ncbi:MAG: hypothetical protein M1834_006404 [Cirrosporium novae-zelandiae]|nr:MAG: hypothetical protein M1834_006404 [Cirrosporium novae-zelandiae]
MPDKSKKRKHNSIDISTEEPRKTIKKTPTQTPTTTTTTTTTSSGSTTETTIIQIITGSYDRVLHGITAIITPQSTSASSSTSSKDSEDSIVSFADTFLFTAHNASIRCLALSPLTSDTQSPKITLASGSSDERINLYSISARPPPPYPSIPSLSSHAIQENPKNRELGSLMHHASTVTALYFPTRSKLISAAEDNTITITRTRDWTAVSTIKAPIPKPKGRPSGDTLALGDAPAGVNDFAIHPSMKLMVSVGRAEKCMRLWNLVTGKKAGVLNFGKDILKDVGEGKWGSGEGRKIVWNEKGEEFAVAFERGVVVFGMDCQPRGRIVPDRRTKVHWMEYLSLPTQGDEDMTNVLAISTEDGRIIFYDTNSLIPTTSTSSSNPDTATPSPIPACKELCSLGGSESGTSTRVKTFKILSPPSSSTKGPSLTFIIIAGHSDGAIRVWKLNPIPSSSPSNPTPISSNPEMKPPATKGKAKQKPNTKEKTTTPTTTSSPTLTGDLVGTYETSQRITCLAAFVMVGTASDLQNGDEEEFEEDISSEDDSSDDE